MAGRIEGLGIVRGHNRSAKDGALLRQVRSAVAAARISWALALGSPPAPAGARPAPARRCKARDEIRIYKRALNVAEVLRLDTEP